MKIIYIILLVIFFVFSTCKSKEVVQNDGDEKMLTSEEFEQLFSDTLYHNSWVFQPGEYYLLSDTIVYEHPNFNSKNIGNLNIHNKVVVIEDVHNQQVVNDTISCWYKIGYNDFEGYIFGGNIARETVICDIDNNGIIDYFQYRISKVFANYHIDTRKDIIIYINNTKIITDKLNAGLNEYGYMQYNFNFCSFEQLNDRMIITLKEGGPVSVVDYIFSISNVDNISFINLHKKGKFFENGEWHEYE